MVNDGYSYTLCCLGTLQVPGESGTEAEVLSYSKDASSSAILLKFVLVKGVVSGSIGQSGVLELLVSLLFQRLESVPPEATGSSQLIYGSHSSIPRAPLSSAKVPGSNILADNPLAVNGNCQVLDFTVFTQDASNVRLVPLPDNHQQSGYSRHLMAFWLIVLVN